MIMVGCPVRNRDWIIEEYLQAIENQEISKKEIHLAFLLNNSTDNTGCIIKNMTKDKGYGKVDIFTLMGDSYYDRRDNRDYKYLADVRNRWLTMRRRSDEYIVNIDSDVILKDDDAISRMINTGLPIISAPVLNLYVAGIGHYNILQYIGNDGFKHIYTPELEDFSLFNGDRIIKVGSTGACVSIKEEVLNSGVHYTFHKSGEDQGFSKMAFKNGYESYCNLDIKTMHVTDMWRWVENGEGLESHIPKNF